MHYSSHAHAHMHVYAAAMPVILSEVLCWMAWRPSVVVPVSLLGRGFGSTSLLAHDDLSLSPHSAVQCNTTFIQPSQYSMTGARRVG